MFAVVNICVFMFFGSYAAGCIPLFINLDERRIRLATIFGAGLLIGTALAVIIPEGISTLYETPIQRTFPETMIVDNNLLKNNLIKRETNESESSDKNLLINNSKTGNKLLALSRESKIFKREVVGVNSSYNNLEKNADQQVVVETAEKLNEPKINEAKTLRQSNAHQHDGFGKMIGLMLTLGFLFMFVIDQFSKSQTAGRGKGVSTIGLVIHAAADGIAMGSALASPKTEIQVIVFLAIMIHKGPAAFALVSFLLMAGLEKFRVRKHLLIFSLAAPIGTIVTYLFLRKIELQSVSSATYGTSLIILFSGGTFLYIAAAHILPELMDSKLNLESASNRSRFSLFEIILFVVSAILPSLFASHHH